MTYPGEQPPTAPGQPPHWPAYGPPPDYQTPPPAKPPTQRRAWLPWTIAGLALLALAVGATFFFVGGTGGSGLSRDVAQRECRTALKREASRRGNLDPSGTGGILVTVKSVDMQETYETDTGWTVNGTVAYTLTSGLVPQVEQSVSLTCDATGTDDAVSAAVKNRS